LRWPRHVLTAAAAAAADPPFNYDGQQGGRRHGGPKRFMILSSEASRRAAVRRAKLDFSQRLGSDRRVRISAGNWPHTAPCEHAKPASILRRIAPPSLILRPRDGIQKACHMASKLRRHFSRSCTIMFSLMLRRAMFSRRLWIRIPLLGRIRLVACISVLFSARHTV